MSVNKIDVRRMDKNDLQLAVAWARNEGWNLNSCW